METSGHGAMRSNRYTSAVARVGLSAMQLPFDALLRSALLERCNQGSCLAVHAPPLRMWTMQCLLPASKASWCKAGCLFSACLMIWFAVCIVLQVP
jgi:hypothetical protein